MNIAILGFGVVGKGVYDIIQQNFKDWNVKYVLEKDPTKTKEIADIVPTSFYEIIKDETVDVVIELIGGKTIAYDFIQQAIRSKKHVVTANKAVISEYFKELTTLAKDNNVSLLFEASVGGAIIVLDSLYKIANHNQINQIEGIINGSTNYVLSSVFLEDKTLPQALQEAHELGYIETGSTDDMDGLDLMRKINILSMISYHTYMKESDISVVPLSCISSKFIEYVKKKNLAMKYIARSTRENNEITIELLPTIISKTDFYHFINYEDNIISVSGTYHKSQTFIGQGAGRYPTAQAIVNDLHIIKSNEQRVHDFKQDYPINKTKKDTYLIQTNKGFEVVEESVEVLLKNEDIICLARVKGDLL